MSSPILPSVSLVLEPIRPDLSKCIICKKKNDSSMKDILSNSVGSRSKIILASQKLNDGLLDSLDEVEVQRIVFHSKSCYSKYILQASRLKETSCDPTDDNEIAATVVSPTRFSNRLSSPPPPPCETQTNASYNALTKLCTICNCITKNKVREKYRICERNRAKCFFAAINLLVIYCQF